MRFLNDQPVDGLRRKLGEFEDRVKTLRRTMEASGISRESLERAVAAAEASVRRVRDDARAAQGRMDVLVEADALAANAHVELWKRDGEIEMLTSRAEGTEAYAAWSLIVATRAICDAELATLKAIAARMDLEDCSTK